MDVAFKSCLNCGSYFVQHHLLCNSCAKLLTLFKVKTQFRLHEAPVKCLYEWPSGVSDTLSHLIINLKKANSKAWDYYAREFCSQWCTEIQGQDLQIITMTSATGNRHAQNWGESLKRYLGGRHIEGLRQQVTQNESGQPSFQTSQQKNKSRESRAFRILEKSVDFSLSSGAITVFADDVLTTGYTALSAYKALGSPKNFQVWCLARRPPSSIAANHAPW